MSDIFYSPSCGYLNMGMCGCAWAWVYELA